jgi:hypothetical protein
MMLLRLQQQLTDAYIGSAHSLLGRIMSVLNKNTRPKTTSGVAYAVLPREGGTP